MARSFADPTSPEAALMAAARERHPAAGLRHAEETPPGFDDAVALLTGSWRVGDPVGFSEAMKNAPVVAGHPVTDLATLGDIPGGEASRTLAGLVHRSSLQLWWVSGTAAGHLLIEARAQAPAAADGPAIFVLAHLLEPIAEGRRALPVDHSWFLALIGDGVGGVAEVLRAMLECPRRPRCCPRPAATARFPLAALRGRLASPALEAETSDQSLAAVLPFSFRG